MNEFTRIEKPSVGTFVPVVLCPLKLPFQMSVKCRQMPGHLRFAKGQHAETGVKSPAAANPIVGQ